MEAIRNAKAFIDDPKSKALKSNNNYTSMLCKYTSEQLVEKIKRRDEFMDAMKYLYHELEKSIPPNPNDRHILRETLLSKENAILREKLQFLSEGGPTTPPPESPGLSLAGSAGRFILPSTYSTNSISTAPTHGTTTSSPIKQPRPIQPQQIPPQFLAQESKTPEYDPLHRDENPALSPLPTLEEPPSRPRWSSVIKSKMSPERPIRLRSTSPDSENGAKYSHSRQRSTSKRSTDKNSRKSRSIDRSSKERKPSLTILLDNDYDSSTDESATEQGDSKNRKSSRSDRTSKLDYGPGFGFGARALEPEIEEVSRKERKDKSKRSSSKRSHDRKSRSRSRDRSSRRKRSRSPRQKSSGSRHHDSRSKNRSRERSPRRKQSDSHAKPQVITISKDPKTDGGFIYERREQHDSEKRETSRERAKR